jgi:thiol-disulfide isomerase/thioredoxin
MAVIQSSNDDLRKFVYDQQYVIVNFYTKDDCPSCDELLRVFEQLSEDYKNITFVLMNANDNPVAKNLINKHKKPFFGVYKEGLLVDCSIISSREELSLMLNKLPNIKFYL